ncbi:uncharacterized protein LOC121263835 [Juglans microcarpa x Juglans regia]|uniref:uncharacterized protein LOC121263835 n=1 Tax=Juglans microcarpa x Juglans regia TaxID=2249226 RepID=UPI001B7F7340|nr:uncharacterized protein LOC121263835 [Juglans microcarpa x Juglans regia]
MLEQTYRRLVNKMFKDQIGQYMNVYINDLLVKSKELEQQLDDLREAFRGLQQYKMKLNPTKCTFKVQSDKFLGFIMSKQGIEANSEKVQAIAGMEPLRNLNNVQRLVRRITALNRRGLRVYMIAKGSTEAYYTIRLEFKVLNNEVEYEAVLAGLAIARALGEKEADMKAYTQVVVSQITEEYLVKGKRLKKYLQQVNQGHEPFDYFQISRIPRQDN